MAVEYAIYKGDDFIMIGTADECAERLGIKADSVKWLSTGVAWRRFNNAKDSTKRMIALNLGKNEVKT